MVFSPPQQEARLYYCGNGNTPSPLGGVVIQMMMTIPSPTGGEAPGRRGDTDGDENHQSKTSDARPTSATLATLETWRAAARTTSATLAPFVAAVARPMSTPLLSGATNPAATITCHCWMGRCVCRRTQRYEIWHRWKFKMKRFCGCCSCCCNCMCCIYCICCIFCRLHGSESLLLFDQGEGHHRGS